MSVLEATPGTARKGASRVLPACAQLRGGWGRGAHSGSGDGGEADLQKPAMPIG